MEILLEIILLLMVGGIPYFILVSHMFSKKIFWFIMALFFAAIVIIAAKQVEFSIYAIGVSILSSLYTLYRISKSKNFYVLSNLIIFLNAPMFVVLHNQFIIYVAISLILSGIGFHFMGRFFEKTYGSANYYGIRSLVIKTPRIAVFLRSYLMNLGLFPPLPGSIFIIVALAKTELDAVVVGSFAVVFVANLITSIRILTEVLFGEENRKIDYFDVKVQDLFIHTVILLAMGLLAMYAIIGALL